MMLKNDLGFWISGARPFVSADIIVAAGQVKLMAAVQKGAERARERYYSCYWSPPSADRSPYVSAVLN